MPKQAPTGSRIRELRLARELSQEVLAVQAGLTRLTVAEIEASEDRLARASLGTLRAIAAVLGVSLAEMIPDVKTRLA